MVAVPLFFTAASLGAAAGGVAALLAIIRDKDRGLAVFVALLPMLMYAVLIVVELIVC